MELPRFIESICFEKGQYSLLDYHQQRVNRAFAAHYPGIKPHDLQKVLPRLDFEEKYKVRLVYGPDLVDVEFALYVPRVIQQIQLIHQDQIDYSHKYEDRSELENLFAQRGAADEILIVKQGRITDSFYANPVFWDGKEWLMPESFLLPGVRRQQLIATDKVRIQQITLGDLNAFEKISLVNALNDLGEVEVKMENVRGL